MDTINVFQRLAEDYPLVYLNPDEDLQETYKKVVLNGEKPKKNSLTHFIGDLSDSMEIIETPVGKVRVVTLGNRHDFEMLLRGLMAAKKGPEVKIPKSQGAAMLTVFNWNRINTHLAKFNEEEQSKEFERFTSVKENYLDMLVVLSRGPYSNISAESIGISEDKWLDLSDIIRRFHELTHVICRRMYPGDIDEVRDELVADAVGLFAAYGYFDIDMEKMFLGIRGDKYFEGRLENYTDNPSELVSQINKKLNDMKKIIDEHSDSKPFDLIKYFM